jgi:hypothetical protein
VNSTTTGTRTTDWYGSIPNVPNSATFLQAIYRGANSVASTQTVSIWSWSTNTWTQLDNRTVSTETGITHTVSGTLANYVSGTSGPGEVRIRVRATNTVQSFYSSGDLMKVLYR